MLSLRSQWFREEIFSVAIHPAGLYIAAGFADKIRLLNILIDDMRVFQEFAVRECRWDSPCQPQTKFTRIFLVRMSLFSHGGHLLVAAIKVKQSNKCWQLDFSQLSCQ